MKVMEGTRKGWGVAVSGDGKRVVSGSGTYGSGDGDGETVAWDVETGECLVVMEGTHGSREAGGDERGRERGR